MKNTTNRGGFTLIEILVVIAIIGILASILIPLAGKAKATALKRRAATEMQGILVAVTQFQADHHYMPWPDVVKVGNDKWASDAASQAAVMDLLTLSNKMNKLYLQIPEKSQLQVGNSRAFVDPWGQPYQVGMDRNLDGQVVVTVIPANAGDQESPSWNTKKVMEKVLVYSPGPPTGSKPSPLKTFDVM